MSYIRQEHIIEEVTYTKITYEEDFAKWVLVMQENQVMDSEGKDKVLN